MLDIRPSLTTVLRQFETVRARLLNDGLLDVERKRPLPHQSKTVAILTSVPSSALADMLRTARERWPMTTLIVVPIPVQGPVAGRIRTTLAALAARQQELQLDALVLARGGGSREDMAVFDDEGLCRDLAAYPLPIVTGLGHEDDLTVADLIADHRAATPTAAIVSLFPDRQEALRGLQQRQRGLQLHLQSRITREQQRLADKRQQLADHTPELAFQRLKQELSHRQRLLGALSPQRWLKRGLALVTDADGGTISSVRDADPGDQLTIQLEDGSIETRVDRVRSSAVSPKP